MGARPVRDWRFLVGLLGVGAAVFVGLARYMRAVERAVATSGLAEQLAPDGSLRPAAEVREAVRSMKLVTVELGTVVTATTGDESWRGDVAANVTAPVTFYYGTDLSAMRVGAVEIGPVLEGYIVTVPAPRRLAVEVMGEGETAAVETGWLRFRSRAGEYYLGLARRALYERARATALAPEDEKKVRETTREQVAALVRAVAGARRGPAWMGGSDAGGVAVTVVFDDGR